MGRLPFVIWMIGWPALADFGEYEDFLRHDIASAQVQYIATLVTAAVWVWIAGLLWRDGSPALSEDRR